MKACGRRPKGSEDRLDDGLPQSLADSIAAYGLTHFKIKLRGRLDDDVERLHRIGALLRHHATQRYAFTLDGNEQFRTVSDFRAFWEELTRHDDIADVLAHLLVVEQPLHRSVALGDDVAGVLRVWHDRPALIIDESDGLVDTFARALDCGYAGTSHKNCKGVIKGLANASLAAHRRATDPTRPCVQTGEDLANVGPVALLQDLAVAATLGIEHVERNGHHYFRGLSMLPDALSEQTLAHHGDLYRRHEAGFATLDVKAGRIDVGSVVDAPLGIAFLPDLSDLTKLEDWTFESLGLEE